MVEERESLMGRAHEAAKYVEGKTNLADEVHVTADGEQAMTLNGVRKRADGSTQEVTIEVRDDGPGAKEFRYTVDIYSEGIEPIHANPASTLELALSNADAHSSALG